MEEARVTEEHELRNQPRRPQQHRALLTVERPAPDPWPAEQRDRQPDDRQRQQPADLVRELLIDESERTGGSDLQFLTARSLTEACDTVVVEDQTKLAVVAA